MYLFRVFVIFLPFVEVYVFWNYIIIFFIYFPHEFFYDSLAFVDIICYGFLECFRVLEDLFLFIFSLEFSRTFLCFWRQLSCSGSY